MEDKIIEMIVDICGDDIVKSDRNIDLLKNEIMDSLDFTELLVAIEDEFGIILAPSEYTREDVSTPNKIIEIVKSRS